MVTESELEGFRRDRYFARAWALLTRDHGWVKPVLVMTVALLVPVVGLFGVVGYIVEWARLTAWGANAAPKQRGVRVGACIRSGARAFVVCLVWGLASALISAVLGAVPLLGDLLSLAWWLFSLFLGLVTMVAVLRATIYQRVSAGLRPSVAWQMATHDAGGLARVFGILLAGGALIGVISTVVMLVTLVGMIPQMIYFVGYFAGVEPLASMTMRGVLALRFIAWLISSLGPALVVLVLIDGFVGVVTLSLGYTALGLWMRQFNVSAWGREEDPLPEFLDERGARPETSGEPVNPVPGAAPADAAGGSAATSQTPDAAGTPADAEEVVEVTPLAVSPAAEEPDGSDDEPTRPVEEPVRPDDDSDDDTEGPVTSL